MKLFACSKVGKRCTQKAICFFVRDLIKGKLKPLECSCNALLNKWDALAWDKFQRATSTPTPNKNENYFRYFTGCPIQMSLSPTKMRIEKVNT